MTKKRKVYGNVISDETKVKTNNTTRQRKTKHRERGKERWWKDRGTFKGTQMKKRTGKFDRKTKEKIDKSEVKQREKGKVRLIVKCMWRTVEINTNEGENKKIRGK